MTAIPFRDGSNNLLYADTARGTGGQTDPIVWKHSDPDIATAIGDSIDAPANASALATTPTTAYNLIQLTKLISTLIDNQLAELSDQGDAIGYSADITANISTLAAS